MLLFDINVLIALADPDHEHHDKTEAFFSAHHRNGWATCPITENGFVRIISHPNYKLGPGSPEGARSILNDLCRHEGHSFWPDDLSLRAFGPLPGSKHLTDHYLLSLAVHRRGKLVTLDRRINASLIPGGEEGCLVL